MQTDATPPKSFTDLIGKLGGSAVVAAATGRQNGTVRQWKKRNGVPPQYWPPLIDLAKEKALAGVDEALLTRLAVARAA